MSGPRYYALVYSTVTGEIIDELPLASLPQWLSQINADGSWTITTQIASEDDQDTSLWPKGRLWSLANDTWRFSVAVCYGSGSPSDYVCQAGPLMSWRLLSEQPPVLQLGGAGLWALLRATMQLNSGWNGVSLDQNGGADATYNGSLAHIARQIMTNAGNRNPMPLDIDTTGPDDDNTRTYYGYDLVSAGQRLQELTQVIDGPDVLLKPYRTADNHIRHFGHIGEPRIDGGGNPLYFDYPGSIASILPTGDASKQATTTYAKGTGDGYTSLWARSSDDTLPDAGWPVLEAVDTSHMDVSEQDTLQQWADGDQALYGQPITTWTAVARTDDEDYPLGSYDPGPTAVYNVQRHCLLPDGEWTQRIIGLQNGDQAGQVRHILQGGDS